MKQNSLLTVAIFVFALSSQAAAQQYRINLQSGGEEIAVIEISIDDNIAITKVGDVTERFDLEKQQWQHDESKQWVSLSQSEAWAKQSKEKTGKSADSIPEQVRSFVLWSLDPAFDINATGNALSLTSGQVDYRIVGEKSHRDLTDYFRYARLNAYKKAMTEQKLPPFAELKVLDELERRKLMPRSMEIHIPGVPGAPSFKMVISGGDE